MDAQEDLVGYYRAELEALRQASGAFALRYPKVAAALELGVQGSADPHTERLIESFAYLTARLQKRMDDRFPEITTGLLGTLYPHMVQPVPPMTIVQCSPDPGKGKVMAGYTVARGTQLFTTSADGVTCRFQTSYDTPVWPLRVTEANFPPRAFADFLEDRKAVQAVLRIRLEPVGCALDELDVRSLRFFLSGEGQLTGMLYELILGHTLNLALFDPASGQATILPASAVRAVGFAEDEDVIPYGAQSQPAYRLLQEYFELPEKFLFFDVTGLEARPNTPALELLFLLDTLPRERLTLTPETFRLGCTPAINLFSRLSEPIRIDHRRSEYRLLADLRRERTTEIHSITSVIASSNPQERSATVRPFYDFSNSDSSATVFWHARRLASEDPTMQGTDMVLSFVDLDFDPRLPPSQTVYANVLCTNRALAAQLSEGALLSTELPSPLASIRCLLKPTATGYPPLGGSSRWSLISNLSLNQLSLDGPHALTAFKKILRLYSLHDAPQVVRQIEGIRSLQTRPVLRRMGTGWQGWAEGKHVQIVLDESFYEGVSMYLFASVLQQFFALYGSVNSFSELEVGTVQKSTTHRFAAMQSGQPRF